MTKTKKKVRKTTSNRSKSHTYYSHKHPSVQAVSCPYCTAPIGERCHGKETHVGRVKLAEQASAASSTEAATATG